MEYIQSYHCLILLCACFKHRYHRVWCTLVDSADWVGYLSMTDAHLGMVTLIYHVYHVSSVFALNPVTGQKGGVGSNHHSRHGSADS